LENLKKAKGLIYILAVLSAMFFVSNVKPTYASQRIYLSPSNYYFTPENGTLGTAFNVTVWVSSDTYPWKLMMWQVLITWNGSLLNVTRVWGEVTGDWTYRAWPNDNFDGRNWDPEYVFYQKKGGSIGNPYYYESYPGYPPGTSGLKIADVLYAEINVTEPKKLCQIEFVIIKTIDAEQYLSTILNINNEDTFLYDYVGQIEDVIIEDGSYEFIPEFTFAALLLIAMLTTTIAAGLKRRLKSK